MPAKSSKLHTTTSTSAARDCQAIGELKVALLPKKNRGQTVNVAISFRWGDEDSLRNRDMAGALAMAMLARGTSQLTRQQIADELTRLKIPRRPQRSSRPPAISCPQALALLAQLLQGRRASRRTNSMNSSVRR
jgi:zinc protease